MNYWSSINQPQKRLHSAAVFFASGLDSLFYCLFLCARQSANGSANYQEAHGRIVERNTPDRNCKTPFLFLEIRILSGPLWTCCVCYWCGQRLALYPKGPLLSISRTAVPSLMCAFSDHYWTLLPLAVEAGEFDGNNSTSFKVLIGRTIECKQQYGTWQRPLEMTWINSDNHFRAGISFFPLSPSLIHLTSHVRRSNIHLVGFERKSNIMGLGGHLADPSTIISHEWSRAIRVVCTISSSFSLLGTMVTIYWFFMMRRNFRRKWVICLVTSWTFFNCVQFNFVFGNGRFLQITMVHQLFFCVFASRLHRHKIIVLSRLRIPAASFDHGMWYVDWS